MRAQRAEQMEAQRAARQQIRSRPQRQASPPPAMPQPMPLPMSQQRVPEAVAPGLDGRPGRLSPDERRALRQQINDANRDVYRHGRP